nr:no significant similarity found [uncultured bacterium]
MNFSHFFRKKIPCAWILSTHFLCHFILAPFLCGTLFQQYE